MTLPMTLPQATMLAPTARLPEALRRYAAGLSPTHRGLLWAVAGGVLFCVLNATLRAIALQLPALQVQALRYLCGVLVMAPLVLRASWRAWWPRNLAGQFTRGAVHTAGLLLWFAALPAIALADTTAIGFTTPLFILIGAAVFLKEPMRWERGLATALGFAGVLIVVGPKLSASGGLHHLLMLASAPVFAASFLITKVLTRSEDAHVIVAWQALSVTLFSLPLAAAVWQSPSAAQWLGFLLCGALGSGGHYCLTRSFSVADISATQSMKFLDLLWSAALGLLLFGDLPTISTLLGGALICGATLWVARREARA